MLKRSIVHFDGKQAVPERILIGMIGDNLSEKVAFSLPAIGVDQSAYVKWLADGAESADIIQLIHGEDDEYFWEISETDTAVAQTMKAYVQITVGESVVWSSQPFEVYVGDLPDVDGPIAGATPTILDQVMALATATANNATDAAASAEAAVRAAEASAEASSVAAEAQYESLFEGETGKFKLQYIPGMTIKRWGVKVPATSATPCERLYDAVGMAAAAHAGSYNASLSNDFDDVFLMKGREERINYDIENRRITAREGDGNFSTDGLNGDVFVRQLAHWRKRERLPDGSEIRAFADGALEGYEYVPERLIASFLASEFDATAAANNGTGKLRSVIGTGVVPLTSVSLTNFLAKARNTGCLLMDMDTWADQADMMLIEFADRNMQAKIGSGISSQGGAYPILVAADATNTVVISTAHAANFNADFSTISISSTATAGIDIAAYRRITAKTDLGGGQTQIAFAGAAVNVTTDCSVTPNKNIMGQSESILKGSGYIGSNGKSAVRYRGVEDVYAHVWQGLLGVLKKGTHPPAFFYCDDPDEYAMSVTAAYREIARDTNFGSNYVSKFYFNESAPFASSLIADEVQGSSTTFWADYVYRDATQPAQSDSRLLVPFAGGSWYYGSYCGPWCVYWHCSPSSPTWYCGARLLVIPPWGVRGA